MPSRSTLAIATTIFLIVTHAFPLAPARASSHREAPLISLDPTADSTDTYVFLAPGDPTRVVLIASFIPFEAPEGGPNYFVFNDQNVYEIVIDNDGNAVPDVIYTLSTTTTIQNPNTFLYNTGPITAITGPELNRRQTFTLVEDMGGSFSTIFSGAAIPPVNIGEKSTPSYQALMSSGIYTYTDPQTSDRIDVFAGPTDDPFWVDLQVFDLLTLRGQAPPIGYSSDDNTPVDSLAGFNVHSLVIEVPVARITNGEPVIGVWARALRKEDSSTTQISRLGMPLVNELVLPLGLKDTFNGLAASADLSVYTLLQQSVEDPEVGRLLCQLYDVPLPADTEPDCSTNHTPGDFRSGRGDIFDIFLTGMQLVAPFDIVTASGTVTLPAGFNVNRPAGIIPAEMIRLNTAIAGTTCSPTPSRLGVLGGDACGFPNGRRLQDDIVDIELLAVAGAAYAVLDGRDTSFTFNSGLTSVLRDGVDGNDKAFSSTFPYLAAPHSGQTHVHTNPEPFVVSVLSGAALVMLSFVLLPYRLVRRRARARCA
ncbi:MAG: DUF4331 domain-containing protein [Candidatus Schekmanbacteria bacterium]|nr:DUF4331 domain-containing protein [Candidatus Schekmanbacteria bacterium]